MSRNMNIIWDSSLAWSPIFLDPDGLPFLMPDMGTSTVEYQQF